jgi:cell division protein DivIC
LFQLKFPENQSMKLLKNIPNWLKNKYLLAGIFFLVWMLFFDPKDIGNELTKWNKYRELQSSEAHLVKKISETKSELNELKNNAQTIEKYAREKYLMKKDNEDLFIVSGEEEVK